MYPVPFGEITSKADGGGVYRMMSKWMELLHPPPKTASLCLPLPSSLLPGDAAQRGRYGARPPYFSLLLQVDDCEDAGDCRDAGAEESLRSLSMERFSGEDDR